MNKDSADKLWLTAYRLHGTLDMPELCRLMIYSMFIKHIDLENLMEGGAELPSYDDKFSVSYLALTYGKLVCSDQLVTYIKCLEGDLTINVGIVSDELEKLLKKSDACHVKTIFSEIDEADFKYSYQLYETATLLLEKLTHLHGNLRNETSSSLSLCRLEGRLLDCGEGMTVYDGFCGNALSLNEAAGGRCTVYIQDLNKSALSIACVVSLLNGNRIGAARCGDSLTAPLSSEKYDRVVCEPPFVSRYDDEYCSSIPEGNFLYPEISDNTSIALRHALAHLKEDGRAVILVPMGILVNYKSSEIRKKLIKTWLDAVIELPAGAIPNAGTAAALLVLKKDTGRKNTYMVDAKSFFEKGEKNQLFIRDESINRIVEMYKKRETLEGISMDFNSTDFTDDKRSLAASRYVVDPKNAITIGDRDASACLEEYHKLAAQLSQVDSRLEAIRRRFIINTENQAN